MALLSGWISTMGKQKPCVQAAQADFLYLLARHGSR
jgi:hypothetical protein